MWNNKRLGKYLIVGIIVLAYIMYLPPIAQYFNKPVVVFGLPLLALWTFIWFLVFFIALAIGRIKEVI